MAAEEPRRNPVAQWVLSAFTENASLKIASLLIAMALFAITRGAGTVQRTLELGVLARLPPPGARRVLLTDLPDKIRVTVRGSPALVANLRADALGPVQVDLSDGRSPSVRFDGALFQLPAGVTLQQVQPSSLQLSWDSFSQREVAVTPQLRGAPSVGTRLAGEPSVTPAVVQLSGASLYVEAVSSVRTEEIDITGLGAGTHERRVTIHPPNTQVQFGFLGAARVRFTIEQEIEEHRFDRVTVTAEGSAQATLRPSVVSVILRGPPPVLRAIEPSQLVPTVDVGEAGPAARGTVRTPVQVLRLPEHTSLVRVEPPDVLVVYSGR